MMPRLGGRMEIDMKKYLKWMTLAGGTLAAILLILFFEKVKVSTEMTEKIRRQPEVVFSAFSIKENDSGTFFYNLETGNMHKESSCIFKEIYYNDNKTRFIAKMEDNSNDGFVGIIEYDIGKKIFIPILSLDEMRKLFENPELVMDDVYAPQYYQKGYSIVYQNKLCILNKKENEWQLNCVYEVPEQDILGPYAWDKNGENFYARIITEDDKWELVQYNIITKKSALLLENVAAFELSPDGNQIVYDDLEKNIYVYMIYRKRN